MTLAPDYAVRELEQLRLTLREDLRFSLRSESGSICYVAEDPVAGAFYRLGNAEYEFVSELDGEADLATVLRRTSSRLGEDAFTLEEATAICQWLLETGLATTADSRTAEMLSDRAQRLRQQSLRRKVHPLFLRFPLVNPDGWVRRLAPLAGVALSWPAGLVWLLVVGAGGLAVVDEWATFRHELMRVWVPNRWLWLAGAWAFLRLVHESAHGAVCRYFGGHVPEGGMFMILGMPIPYVDVTSSWRFGSKYHRIAVSAAGMYAEVFVAALAALLWSASDAATTRSLAQYVIVSAGFTTIVFNLNVLMRFDGYYMLVDWMELPNLYSRGTHYLGYLYRRFYLGLPVKSPLASDQHANFIRIYAVAALGWRIAVMFGLMTAAVLIFGELGWLLVVATVLMWLVVPGYKAVRGALFGDARQPGTPGRFLAMTSLVVALLMLAAWAIPSPWGQVLPAVVDYADLRRVRNESPGFIRSVEVTTGQRVKAGEVLVQLENPELTSELANLRLVRQQIATHQLRDLNQREMAVHQARDNELEVVDHQIALLATRTEALTLLSPIDGRIVATEIESLIGRYVEAGTELLIVADERNKELVLATERVESTELQGITETRTTIRGGGQLRTSAPVFEPRATRTLPHPAFAADAGGMLAVRPVESSSNSADVSHELAAPAFRGRIPLSNSQAEGLLAGQRASVRLIGRDQTLGDWLRRILAKSAANWRAVSRHVPPTE